MSCFGPPLSRRLRSLKLASLTLILAIAWATGCAESGTAPAPYNRVPATVGVIPAEAVTAVSPPRNIGDRPSLAVDVAPYFSDPDGDRLLFSATSSDTSVARASAAGGTVAVTVAGAGTATITAIATDPGGLTAPQTFRIEVAGGLAAQRRRSQVTVADGGGSKRTYRTGETITTLPTGLWTPDAIEGATFVIVITSTSPPRGTVTIFFDHHGYVAHDGMRYTCITADGCRIDMRTVGLGSIEATGGGGGGAPDLVVESPSVSDASPAAGASFTLRATVRNQGGAQSASTTLRYYRSSNATISSSDQEVGTDAVGGLAASGTSAESINLRAPAAAGTYHYGACVEAVAGESDGNNNCSRAVPVTIEGGGAAPVLADSLSVRTVYAIPRNREFVQAYSDSVGAALHRLQIWYRDEMDGLTFALADTIPEVCRLSVDDDFLTVHPGGVGERWNAALDAVSGCGPKHNDEAFIWVVYFDVDEPCWTEERPLTLGRGGSGLTMMGRWDLLGLTGRGNSLPCGRGGQPHGRWVGGLAHELGHAFGLPHPPGCDAGAPTCDNEALMWLGFARWPDTYLRDDERAILRESPFFEAR